MKEIYFKVLKYTIVVWTLTLTIVLILSAIFCKQLANEWTEFYLSQHQNMTTNNKPMMKLVNNSHNNVSFYEYDPKGHGLDRHILKNSYIRATIVLILITSATGAIFHLIGFIGSLKSIHCFVLSFAIYMTFSSIMLFINSFTNYWEFIVCLICSIVTILSYALCSGIREQRFRNLGVGAIDQPNLSQTSINTNYIPPENYYKLYPDLPPKIFCVESQQRNECAHTPVTPSAPPLPTQYIDFSQF